MQATLAKLPTELVNAFSTFRNSPAPFSIQCGRKQNGTQNEKQEQNEANKTRTETEHRAQWERRSRWKRLNYILGIVALSVFQFVIVCLRRHRKILNGNFAIWFIEGVRERSQQRGEKGRGEGRQTAVFALQVPAKFRTEMNSFMASILYFGYPLLWQSQSAVMICQRKVFVTALCCLLQEWEWLESSSAEALKSIWFYDLQGIFNLPAN